MAIQGLYKIFDHWHTEGTLHIISDFHFNDPDLAHIAGRPSAGELVQRINSKCGRNDTLICLGDVGDFNYVRQLRAKRKILIMGNHDAGRSNYERQHGVCFIPKSECETAKDAIASAKNKMPGHMITISETEESWAIFYDNKLFDEVYEGPLMIAEKLILSHEPVDMPWAFNIHGHDHTGRKTDKRHFNVCADVIGYMPINMNQWMKEGHLARIESIHRTTIDKATDRKRKRGGKKIGER